MNSSTISYGLFYALGFAFWAVSMDLSQSTLICVFYSFFVGTVWGMVSKVTGTEALGWRHFLPPVMLLLLMMFSVRLRMVISSEVVFVTAMALLHFRAGVLAFSRLFRFAKVFSALQLASFVFTIVYLFQKNFSIPVARNFFFNGIVGISVLSLVVLFLAKRNFNESSKPEVNDPAIGS